ncbi:MAG TPA: hypothetical protein VGG25_10325 [Streptosporangiaceae bacterium]
MTDTVHVHLASSDVPLGVIDARPPAPARGPDRRRQAAVMRYLTLTTTAAVLPLLAADLSRAEAWAQAFGNDVVICTSKGDALTTAQTSEIAGAVLPHANTAPTLIRTTDEVWITALAFPAQVSLIIHHKPQDT